MIYQHYVYLYKNLKNQQTKPIDKYNNFNVNIT